MVLVYVVGVCTVIAIIATIRRCCNRFCRRGHHRELPARDITKGHRWCPVDRFSRATTTYCNITGDVIYEGYFCDSCEIRVAIGQTKLADRQLQCKALSVADPVADGRMLSDALVDEMSALSMIRGHHWIRGNLPVDSSCAVCDQLCGISHSLADKRCCWCARTAHDRCVGALDAECDLGVYKVSDSLEIVGFSAWKKIYIAQ